VALQIEPSTFTSFYAEARLSPTDLISLIAPDGITYARRTGSKESSGEDIHKSPLFVHVAQHPDSFYFAPDAIHNIPTWFSYRKLKEYPIIATVGSAETELLAVHAGRQGRMMTPRIIISLLVVLFSVLISFILLYRLRASIRRREEQEQYKRLLTEQIIAAQEKEREWIGREMHDNVSQVLTTVKLYLEMASTTDGSPFIPKSMQLINQSITEIRSLSHQLSAPTLGTRSLIDSITALIEMVRQSSALTIRFHAEGGEPQLPMDRKLALYRILQELFNNIVKHSGATKVEVTLAQQDHQVLLSVKDNGKGFDKKRKSRGIGLNNIYSRANIMGGRIVLDTAPGKGFGFQLTIPMLPSPQTKVLNEIVTSRNATL
ncbi:MAG TPA: ATP-binding protein, partial [Flavisolibacter sp.]|nr:ATP-binding protein [Flavisolibacter sp.]